MYFINIQIIPYISNTARIVGKYTVRPFSIFKNNFWYFSTNSCEVTLSV